MPDPRENDALPKPPADKPGGDGAPAGPASGNGEPDGKPDELTQAVEATTRVGAWLADQLDVAPDDVDDAAYALALAAALAEESVTLDEAKDIAAEAAREIGNVDDDLAGESDDDTDPPDTPAPGGAQAPAKASKLSDQPRVPAGDSAGGQFAPADGGGGAGPSQKDGGAGKSDKPTDGKDAGKDGDKPKPEKKGIRQRVKDALKSVANAPRDIEKAIREKGVVGAAKEAGGKMAAGVKGAAKGMEDGLVKAGVNRTVAKGVAVAAAVITTTPLSVGVVAAGAGLAPAWVAMIPGALEAGGIYSATAGLGKAVGKAKAAVKAVRERRGAGAGKKPKAAATPHVSLLDAIDRAILESTGSVAAMSSGVLNGTYQYVRTEEGLLVPRTEVMTFITPDERPDFRMAAQGVDEAWLLAAIKTHEIMALKGKRPRLFERHNSFLEPADVIGRLLNPRFERPWLVADALITNPAACGRAARGEYPSRSAEFVYETHYLWGLSLIKGQEGHFDEELPDFVLAEQADIAELRALGTGGGAAPPLKARSNRIVMPLTLNLQGGAMPDDQTMPPAAPAGDKKPDANAEPPKPPEDDAKWKAEVNARLANVEAWMKAQQAKEQAPAAPVAPAPVAPAVPVVPGTTPQPQQIAATLAAAQAENKQLVAALAAERAERAAATAAQLRAERAAQIERDAADIRAAGSHLLIDDIRKALAAPSSAEAYKLTVQHLKSQPKPPTDDLPAEPTGGASVSALKAKYAEIAAAHAARNLPAPYSEAEYLASAARH